MSKSKINPSKTLTFIALRLLGLSQKEAREKSDLASKNLGPRRSKTLRMARDLQSKYTSQTGLEDYIKYHEQRLKMRQADCALHRECLSAARAVQHARNFKIYSGESQ